MLARRFFTYSRKYPAQAVIGGFALLPLDSPRWMELTTFFDRSQELPLLVERWYVSVGHDTAGEAWSEVQTEILHQFSTIDAAYAVSPYLADALHKASPTERLIYLVDLGLIEAARQTEGPLPPDDLIADYQQAIVIARHAVLADIRVGVEASEFRYYLTTIANLFGHPKLGDLLFNLGCIEAQCPQCGAWAYPEEIQKSGYV